jgi:hypothetical protein
MRFATIVATIFTLALSTLAQTTDSNNVDPNELLVELAQLPECAVSEWILLLAAFAAHCGANHAEIVRFRRLA